MMESRTMMMTANQPGIAPRRRATRIAAKMSSLSAMGSRRAPSFEAWLSQRARKPSTTSVAAATRKIQRARSFSAAVPEDAEHRDEDESGRGEGVGQGEVAPSVARPPLAQGFHGRASVSESSRSLRSPGARVTSAYRV
jgi:hypothetical protein